MQNLVIDAARLWGELMETAADRRHAEGRHLPADADRSRPAGARLVQGALRGARLHRNRRRHGRDVRAPPGPAERLPPIAMGSHLDTQPTGGKFDGVLGVLGALEALRTLVQAGYETYAPIEVINWTNEEGSRFAPAMVASGVFAGAFTRDWAETQQGSGRHHVWCGARLDRLSRRAEVRRPSALGLLRTAHRAGADPRGRGQGRSASSPACRGCAGTR